MKLWRTNYNPMTIENVPVITDMCINEGVLYCTLKEPAYKIYCNRFSVFHLEYQSVQLLHAFFVSFPTPLRHCKQFQLF